MPALTISITFPPNGSSIPIPNVATGTYSGSSNPPQLTYQINAGGMRPITNFTGTTWSINLSTADCPMVGMSNVLSVFVGNPGPPPQMGNASSSFTRSS